MGATRFPGKPLAVLAGRPMLAWVVDGARTCSAINQIVVATPDQEIIDVATGLGVPAVLTSADHSTGTDRVAEVAAQRDDVDIVVNIQGDQPFVDSTLLDALLSPFESADVTMTTVGAPLDESGFVDPNTVKVVMDRAGRAMYFSRAPIPHFRRSMAAPVLHHLGLYAFRRDFLSLYTTLEPTPLEQVESLEQLRVLESGYDIWVAAVPEAVPEVNTPADFARAEALLADRARPG